RMLAASGWPSTEMTLRASSAATAVVNNQVASIQRGVLVIGLQGMWIQWALNAEHKGYETDIWSLWGDRFSFSSGKRRLFVATVVRWALRCSRKVALSIAACERCGAIASFLS